MKKSKLLEIVREEIRNVLAENFKEGDKVRLRQSRGGKHAGKVGIYQGPMQNDASFPSKGMHFKKGDARVMVTDPHTGKKTLVIGPHSMIEKIK